MAKHIISPEEQIHRVTNLLNESEYRLEQKGLPMYGLRIWLNEVLYQRELMAQHERGELASVEWDDEDNND